MKPDELQKLYSEEGVHVEDVREPESSPRFKKVSALMKEYREPRKVLDVGCATGTLLQPFTRLHDITGVDVSELLMAEALRNGYRKVVALDVATQPLPFADKTFDVVFCGECIEHVVDTDWVFCEINRVLKPGGHLILTFPNIRTPISMLMMLFNLPPMYSSRYRSAHFRDFTTGTMALALKNSELRIDKIQGVDFYIHKIGHCFSGLASLLPSWASSIVLRAIKARDAAYSVKDVARHEIFKAQV